MASDGRCVHPDHRGVGVDRCPKVGATQAAGTADDRTRGVGALQWLTQVALVPPERLQTLSLRLPSHPHPKWRRLRKQAARPLGCKKRWRRKPLDRREAARRLWKAAIPRHPSTSWRVTRVRRVTAGRAARVLDRDFRGAPHDLQLCRAGWMHDSSGYARGHYPCTRAARAASTAAFARCRLLHPSAPRWRWFRCRSGYPANEARDFVA